MLELLLQTKLRTPIVRRTPETASPRFVPRPHLLARLDQGMSHPLTLVSAPAGFGKTTLLSEWISDAPTSARSDRPVFCWVSLDEADNDPARFWAYWIAALQGLKSNLGEQARMVLQSRQPFPLEDVLTTLLNEISAYPNECVLVLDDYHAIENATVHQALAFVVDHLPPQMHLVLTTRADPPLPLARWRARRQLFELRADDLRFTPGEVAAFLDQVMGLNLSADDVAALGARTEGWIAGLQMAALSMQGRDDVHGFVAAFTGSQRYIVDYLVEEVLNRQPDDIRTFLLQTCILDRLTGPLCDAVLGHQSQVEHARKPDITVGQQLLEQLERANLFIVPLDDERRWYRYHQLFAEVLRQRLNQVYPDRVSALHQSASQWYEEAGLTEPAVRHALAAQAFGRAAALVERVAPAMIQRSELAGLLTWLEALPQAQVLSRPLLALYNVQVLFLSGEKQRAVDCLQAIEAVLAVDPAKQSTVVQGHIAVMRSYLARETGDLEATIVLSRKALTHLPRQDSLVRAIATLNLAMAHYLQGEFDPASQLLADTIATGQTAELTATILFAIYVNAQLLRAQGALRQALQLCQEGLESVNRRGWHNLPTVGSLYVILGELLREQNELSQAAELLDKGISLGRAGGHYYTLIIGHVWLAWLRQTQGDAAGSHDAIRVALQLVQHDPGSRFWPLPQPACYQARLWIAQGDFAAADHWAQTIGFDQSDASIPYLYEAEYLTLARLWIAQGKLESAETLLLRLRRGAASSRRCGSLIGILVLQAIAFAAQERIAEALSAFEQALALAEPEGFVRVFLDEGTPVTALLRQAVAHGSHARYALRLLNAAGEPTTAPQSLIEPLSERELQVVRRVAAGYSNQEIARDLVLAVSTVKKHVNNIYGKLEVRNRTQAVAKARELGLL